MKRLTLLLAAFCLALPAAAFGGIDLVTLPDRDSVQLTIYNSADLTLVRDVRTLTLKKGINKLSFGWANTLIDPTSLELRAIKNPDKVNLLDVTYPPRMNTVGVWTVQSGIEGEVPVEITFFTSGITWSAFYMATLTPDEKQMRLQGYVRVTNRSGEDYPKAQTRLIVGKVNLLDQIAQLARRAQPYGRPGRPVLKDGDRLAHRRAREQMKRKAGRARMLMAQAEARPKEIRKEGLSEYFLYTIEGTETILNGWSKRLSSFQAAGVPVVNLYKYEERRYGRQVRRFLYFKNDKTHKLGDTPLPGGLVKVYRTVDQENHLSYEGADNTKYIPVEQKVELNLGPARKVAVEPKMMNVKYENHTYDRHGNINGWDEVRDWKVEVKNHRDIAVRVEIKRNLRHQYWDLKESGDYGKYEKDDLDTVKFTLDLPPHTKKVFNYTIRYKEGERRRVR